MRQARCPKCGVNAGSHPTIGAGLHDEENYFITKRCRHCGNEFNLVLPLALPSQGQTYRLIYINGKGYQMSHLVWQWKTGNPIPKGFIIHHINGNRQDNRFGNLYLMQNHKHSRIMSTSQRIPILLKRIRQLEGENYRLRHQAKL